jgi:glycosyltransferase involved in cell wall biosynthesis
MSQETEQPAVSFVVPLYNTGTALPRLLEAFSSLQFEMPWELVLVDDGSTDGTTVHAAGLLNALPVPVKLVALARNYGEHAAVLEGMRHTRGQWVVNLDDDLQNPLSEALKLLQHLQESGADVVYSRYRTKQHHWLRNMGSRLVNACATVLLGKPKELYLSSFRAMRRELVERIVQYRGPYPYIDGLILGATNRIESLEVEHEARAEGKSGYTLRKFVQLSTNMMFNFSIMPLRLASLLGGLLCLAGLCLLIEVLIETFSVGRRQLGWGSLMAGMTIFSGAQLLMLGIIGEYVGRAFLTVSGKPQSLVRSTVIHQSREA